MLHYKTTSSSPGEEKEKRYLAHTLQLPQVKVHFGCLVDKVIIRLKLVSIKKTLIRAKTLKPPLHRREPVLRAAARSPGSTAVLGANAKGCTLALPQVILTDALENPLGLVLPPDPEEVNRNPT